MTTKELTYDELDVRIKDIYELMGYGDSLPDTAVTTEVDAMLSEIRQWLRPRMAFFVTRDFEGFEVGKIISHQLKKAEAYCFFVCTAGQEYQDFMERASGHDSTMPEGVGEDMFRAYLAHSIGSALVERCADKMEEVLQAQIDKLGWHRTNRFSPGYCGWHVMEQQKLFPLFCGETCGVSLTDSSLMMPIKSVSGVIGLGKDVRYLPYTCGLCNYADCYKRKKR
ncbi:MAG: methionine synthase [Prevotella sp.]|nr:methionine synthase [Prevotella sp.]